MCDCFHLAFPNWHAASSGTGAGRRLRGPEPGAEDDSTCDEPSQFTEEERPRPQGSSPVEEYPETEKYTDSDKECEAEHDTHHESGSGKKTKKSGLGSMFEKRSTPKMSKLKEVPSPESGVIVKTAKDGCAEGLVYGGGGREGIFIKEVVPESPASKSLKLKEGDQILSATVYFDNMSYEDAIQILEHAQAYKVKLCLKRKPDITETEPAIESDIIPEEDLYPPEMREQGKTKRRGDARISWPKFPSFGKGRKSRFTRSHSSSEADEQRKLELSPTTSDTESPIKSQDALKGKKRHKMKLSALTKKGRTSSSEDQETPTTGQISGKIVKAHDASDMLSPECLESPSGETPEVYVTEDVKVVKDLRLEQNDQKLTELQTVQHKVELITIDSTLKTADLTVALGDKESSSSIKSPDGKKKKKERSELKMKILGKDKSHKKDTKAKSSPKRLKTLGASIEIPDQPENEKSDIIQSFESHTKLHGDQLAPSTTQIEMSVPKVELDISDVAFIRKSPQKGEEKSMKGKEIKLKQETKTGPTFKLPTIDLSDMNTEEIIQEKNVHAEECTTKIEQLTTEGTEIKEDPYEQLSKSSLSRTQLPKREEIEIPGMEDMSMRTKAKGQKQPKAGFMGHYEELQAETVQLSIDVESVKEAVSKLPGYKLPKVDTSGVPIPDEITVIDANAQRISVKTPTKVVDTKTKHETHFTNIDVTASPEISKTTVKLPKITPADLTSEEFLTETKVDFKKTEKKHKTKTKQSDTEIKTEVYKREDIIIPGKESAHTDKKHAKEGIKSTAKFSPKGSDKKSKHATMAGFGIAKPNIKVPNIGIDLSKQNISQQKGDTLKGEGTILIQEVKTSKTEISKGKGKIGGVTSDVKIHEIDSIEYIDSVDDSSARKDVGITGFGVNLDAAKPNTDIFIPEIRGELKDVDAEEHTIKTPKFRAVTVDISMPDVDKDINTDGAEIKTFERDGKGSKFKMPNLDISMPKVKGPKIDLSLSKKDVDVTLPEAKAEVTLEEVPQVGITFGNVDVSEPKLEIQPLQTDVEKGSKSAITMPKGKGPQVDLSFSKKDRDVPEAKANIKIPEEANISFDMKQLQSKAEMDVQGSKFKMPKLGIKIPKVKGPAMDFSLSKKDVDLAQPETKAEVKLPDVELEEPSAKVEIKSTATKDAEKDAEGSLSKFKMPTLKLPKIGGADTSISDEESNKIKAIQIPEAKLKLSKEGVVADIKTPNIDTEGPSIDVTTTAAELNGKGSKFKMPKFEISLPKVKGPETDLSLSKKDVDVTLSEAKAEVKLPDFEPTESGVKVEVKAPEFAVRQQDFEGSPSKYKMPTFKLPKFGVGTPNISVKKHDMDKDAKIRGDDINILEEEFAVNIAAPSVDTESPLIDMKTTGTEQDEKGSKFKMPHLGFTMPKVKGPKIDLSLSKKDVDVTLPEHKADVALPEADLGKQDEAKMEIPETKAELKLPEAPKIALDMEPPQYEAGLDGHGGKFKTPKFGIKMPKVKGPEFDLSLSKKDVDVTLRQTKLEVKLPDAPEMDVSLGKAEVLIPEAKAEVEKPELGIKPSQTEVKGQGSKFKMPKFGMAMPKVKGPEFHLGLLKTDTDVTVPEAKADVNLPDIELKEPSAKASEIEVLGKDTEGSPSKFKMPDFSVSMPKVKASDVHLSLSKEDTNFTLPGAEVKLPAAPKSDILLGKAEVLIQETKMDVKKVEIKPLQTDIELKEQGGKFKMPKFGITMPKVKGPEIDLSFSKKAEVELPEAPQISMEMKPPECEAEIGGQGSKFKVPKFGISMPKAQGPEIDIGSSKEDVDIILPEAKADVSLPDVELQEPSAKVEITAPKIEAQLHSEKESPSKFKMPTFKFPKFGVATANVSAEVPDIDKEIKTDGADMHISVPHTDIDKPDVKAQVHVPGVEVKELSDGGAVMDQSGVEVDVKMKKPRFSLPRFSFSKPSVKAPEVDASLLDVNAAIPEERVEEKEGKMDIKPTECETEVDGQGSKFKMPKFGITIPKVKGPEIDLSLSKKEIEVALPEAKVEGKLPDMELKVPCAEVEIKAPETEAMTKDTEGSPSKLKTPLMTFNLPKFGVGTPSTTVQVPDMDKDVKFEGADIKFPEEVLTVDIAAPSIDTDGLSVDLKGKGSELEGSGSKFKMPKFGISMPKVKGPEIDLSLSKKDIDVALPEVKAEAKLPDVELKEPSAEVEIKAPKIKVATKNTEGSPLKFKMPTFSLPKFGVGTPSTTVQVPDMDKDVKFEGADIKFPEEVLTVDIAAPSIDTEGPSIDMKTTGTEHEGKGSKFKMPSLGFSVPQVKQPDIKLSLSKKDVDVTLPEAKADVKLPDVELEEPSAKVEIKTPGIDVQTSNVEGSPSKFKMPILKLPKFGAASPKVSVEGPDVDKDLKVDGADLKIPQTEVEVKLPDVEIKEPVGSISVSQAPITEVDAKLKKTRFSLPKFSFSKQSTKEPGVDVSLPGADVSLPEANVEVKQPEVELKPSEGDVEFDEQGSKFKMPKFGVSMPKVKGPKMDLSLSVKDVDVTLPEAKAEVQIPDVKIKGSSAKVDITAPEINAQAGDVEGSPSKLKMPTITLPKLGAGTPDVNVEVPNVDKNVTIDGAKLKLPKEGVMVDVTAPSIDTDGLSVDLKGKGSELEGSGSKFKLPKFGISMPKVKGPEIDLSLSKKDVDLTVPEAKAEVKLPEVELKEPSAEVEIKAPKIKVATKNTEGSPSKFKMPTFSLPKFGVGTPSTTVQVPDMDKDVKFEGADIKFPEEILTVDIAAPSIDTEGPSIDMKTKGTEHEGKGSKFKMPSLGFSVPQVKQPDIRLSLSKKDVDVTLPEAKVDVKLPDVELEEPSAKVEIKTPGIDVQTSNVEGSPSKFKMPTFKLPKFGAATPQVSVEGPAVDKDLKVDGADLKIPQTEVEVKLPDVEIKEPVGSISVSQAPITEVDAKLKKTRFSLPKFSFSKQSTKESGVDVSLPEADVTHPEGNLEVKQPEVELKPSEGDVEFDGQGSKFKMPKFGVSLPKVKGPEIDLSLSKKDVDVALPEVKAEVQIPDVKIKGPSAKVAITAPEINAQAGNVEGSPSKLKMPTFTLPKFGAATPKVSVEVSDVNKDIKIDGEKLRAPKEGATVDITAPSIDTDVLSVDVKAKESKLEGSGSKFKMPKFGISMPKVKGPEIDLSISKKDVDVALPEAKAEVKLPEVELKEPSAEVEIKAPDIKVATKNTEGSPSKFKMPTFSFPKFGVGTPSVTAEVPETEKDVKFDGGDVKIPEEVLTVDIAAPSIETKGPSIDMKTKGTENEEKGSKFKMPSLGFSVPQVKRPDFDLSLSKKDIDVTLPEAKAEVKLPDSKLEESSAKVEIKAPGIDVQTSNVEGSPSKFKMPTFTFPKFGGATPKVSVEVPDVDKDNKIDGTKMEVPKEGTNVDVTAPSIDTENLPVDVKDKGSKLEGSGSKFKMPKFGISMPTVKGPEIDLSTSKKDVDVTLPEAQPEVKLPNIKVEEPKDEISVPDAPTLEVEAKLKQRNWTFPKFSFSRTGGKPTDVDANLETPKVDVTSPEAKAEVCLTDVEVQGSSGTISMEEQPAAKTKFSLPRFSLSKTSVKESGVSAELLHVDSSLPEGNTDVKQPETEIKAPEFDTKHDGQGSRFKLPKFGIALPKAKGPEEDLDTSQKEVGITLPEVKAEVTLPETEVKTPTSVDIKGSETEAKSKDVGGSPLKFKMPTIKMPKLGGATYGVTIEAPDADKVVESDGAKLKEDVTVNIKGQNVDIKTDASKVAITDTEMPETHSGGQGSPSKFKLPSFKMPKLSFTRPKPEDEYVPVETECEDNQLEMEVEPKGEVKSPKMTLTSFGEILKNIDVEFDVTNTDKEEKKLDTTKEVHETDEPSGKQLESESKETKQDTTKSPERTSWFKFPKFGLSSPSEPVKISEKDEHKDVKSPVGETVDDEVSPTCSVQSSDAFADISSAMTSEYVGLSLSSPTKVTVKYSDPYADIGIGEMHRNIITSTTRTELISVEPNLPEKITIQSSGVSSSSEDTLRLESGKIHVITSNIQATPEAQHAKLLTSVQVESPGGFPLKSENNEAASWTVKDSQSGKRTVFERHLTRETSGERSESKETIVITKQITHMFDSSEPISGETASSIQRLRASVHSEKMRFFDGAEK